MLCFLAFEKEGNGDLGWTPRIRLAREGGREEGGREGGREGGKPRDSTGVCWFFFFKDTEPMPLQDSFSGSGRKA